jgi:hypothetical protein
VVLAPQTDRQMDWLLVRVRLQSVSDHELHRDRRPDVSSGTEVRVTWPSWPPEQKQRWASTQSVTDYVTVNGWRSEITECNTVIDGMPHQTLRLSLARSHQGFAIGNFVRPAVATR